jgi:hypothetical protein
VVQCTRIPAESGSIRHAYWYNVIEHSLLFCAPVSLAWCCSDIKLSFLLLMLMRHGAARPAATTEHGARITPIPRPSFELETKTKVQQITTVDRKRST